MQNTSIASWLFLVVIAIRSTLFPEIAQANSAADFNVDSSDSSIVRFTGTTQAVISTNAVFQRCTFGMTWEPATTSCIGSPTAFNSFPQAQAAVDQLNQQLSLTNYQDQWRIANINELRLLVTKPASTPPTIFPEFPNTPAATFWSSTQLSVSKQKSLGYFILDFSTAEESISTDNAKYIRLVRGYAPNLTFDFQVYPPDPRVIIDVGTVNTGLMFQRCTMGMQWDAQQQQCTGAAKVYGSTPAANDDIAAINTAGDLGGTNKWRLPSSNELGSTKPGTTYMPSTAPYILPIFPNTPAAVFFTSQGLFKVDYNSASNNPSFASGKHIRLVAQGPDVIHLSVTAGPNGSVDRSQVETVPPGFMSFQAMPDWGFRVASAVGDTCHVVQNILVPVKNSYQIIGAPRTCLVTITFERDPNFVPLKSYSGTTQPDMGHGGTATASFTGGGLLCGFDTRASDTGFVPAPASLPPDGTLPQGMFQFKLAGCDNTPVRMTITWPAQVQTLRKFGFEHAGASTRSYFAPGALSVNDRITSFTLIDGLQGDDDWVQNGEIVDPVGPVLLTHSALSPVAVPGPSAWLAIVTGTGILGLLWLRRKTLPSQHV